MQSSLMSMLPLVLMFVVLYFVMIRLLGKVTKLGDGYISAEIANGVEIQLQRSAVVQVLPKGTIK